MSKLPLVLVPGLLCDEALWAHQAEHLADIAEVHIADVSGTASGAESMAVMAEDVLEAAPPRFALAGLSMGGYVSFEIMRRAPDRVVKLALLDTQATPDNDEQLQRRRALIVLAEQGRFKGVTRRLLPLLVHAARLSDKALCGAVMDMGERVGRDAFFRQQRAIMGRPDSRPGLADVRCPTLVLCGREDALTPVERHQEIAESIPGARFALIEDCGHLSTMERPQAVTALLRLWLEHGD